MNARYLTAEICLNGHVTTDGVELWPESTAKFCPKCGSVTIRCCQTCGNGIRGEYYVENLFIASHYSPPNNCHNCGRPFAWTEAKILAAKEYAQEVDHLDDAEKVQLQSAIDDIAAGGVRTELAISRFKRLTKKAGLAIGSGLYSIVVDVASEAAKKALLGS